jgi:TRAP-type transport system small permease protein
MSINSVKRMVDRITLASQFVAQSTLMFVVLLTAADVVGRYFLNRPIPGTQEITGLLLVVVAFLSFAYVEMTDSNIRVDLLIAWVRPTILFYLECFVVLVSLGAFLVLSWQGVRRFVYLDQQGDVTGYLQIPISPFLLVLAIGCALVSCQLICKILRFDGKGGFKR